MIAAATVLVGVLVLVAGFRLLGGDGGSEAKGASAAQASPSPSASRTPAIKVKRLPTKVPTRAPALDADQKAAGVQATSQLVTFLTRSSAALARNDGKAAVTTLAAGPALGEIESMAVQNDHEKLTMSGAPKVLGSKVVAADLSSTPQSVTVAVCLDNSPVVLRDAKGRNLSKHRSASVLKVLNLYGVQRVKGTWLVVNHSIPADSSCKQLKL